MKGFKSDGSPRFSDGEILNCGMDNVLASKLGQVALDIKNNIKGGDHIDFGLQLCRLLNEAGFEVREKQ